MMTALVYVALGVFFATAITLWIYAFYDLARSSTFSDGCKKAWFWVILLAPVGGSIAYLSARKNVEKYSNPDSARLARLLAKEK